MFEAIVESVEKSFERFSVGRVLYLVFLVAVVVGGLYAYDRATGFSRYSQVEKRIVALERLRALEERGIEKSGRLAPIYHDTVTLLREKPESYVYVFDPAPLVKVLSAAAIPLLFAVGALLQVVRGKADSMNMFLGSSVAAIFLGVPALFVPTVFGSLAATTLLLLIVQGVLIRMLVRWNQRKAG